MKYVPSSIGIDSSEGSVLPNKLARDIENCQDVKHIIITKHRTLIYAVDRMDNFTKTYLLFCRNSTHSLLNYLY